MSASPWTAFFPENVSKNPAHFVGPNVAGAIVQGIETGIIINQSIKFWSNASDEQVLVRALVAFVSIAAGFQTAVAFYNTWVVVVIGFGNWMAVVNLRWPDRIQPALNCLMAAPVQAFLIWRCWNAMQRKFLILVPLIVLLVASIVANIVITTKIFKFSITDVILSRTPPRSYITAFVLTAVLDICITSLMLWFLVRAKSQVVSRRLDKIIGRLLTMLWEAAFPPCACAIVACAVYITMSMENLWDVFCQSILGKLYVISLFVILNGRADLKSTSNNSAHLNPSAGLTQHYVTAAEVRVNLTTFIDVDQQDEELTPTSEQFSSQQQCIPHHSNSWGKDGNIDSASIKHVETTLGSGISTGHSEVKSESQFRH